MKALVAFGTKYGSTAQVADVIAGELRGKGYLVDVADLRQDDRVAVDGYDLVVVGSSVFMGRWTKGAQEFLRKNAACLPSTRTALFVSCSDVLFPEKAEAGRKMYLEDVAAKVPGLRPAALGMFGGVIDFAKYGTLTKVLLKGVGARKDLEGQGIETSRPYDYRDWDEIRAWARAL